MRTVHRVVPSRNPRCSLTWCTSRTVSSDVGTWTEVRRTTKNWKALWRTPVVPVGFAGAIGWSSAATSMTVCSPTVYLTGDRWHWHCFEQWQLWVLENVLSVSESVPDFSPDTGFHLQDTAKHSWSQWHAQEFSMGSGNFFVFSLRTISEKHDI
jgi:hypothetical protein